MQTLDIAVHALGMMLEPTRLMFLALGVVCGVILGIIPGIGGLSAAVLLAKIGKMRVLVLEKHFERGGLTHVFRRDGASWDVGVHYVGNMEKGSRVRTLFDFMSGGALDWNRMPDEFERFVYPGFDFTVPSDPRQYRERLISRFPDEAAAIRRYFADLNEVFN